MAEPEEIIGFIREKYFRGNELAGKKVLVTAGPTYEAIDPVRFIGNHSSGKMGYALADIFFEKGADVTLVSGPSHITPAYSGIQLQKITSADEMFNLVMENSKEADIIIMSAAVADYTPSTVFENKLKKQTAELELKLMKTKDILHHLGAQKKPGQFIAGFALETDNEITNAEQKLLKKNADCIILNSLRDVGAGFGTDTNTITIYCNEFAMASGGEIEEADFDFPVIVDGVNYDFDALQAFHVSSEDVEIGGTYEVTVAIDTYNVNGTTVTVEFYVNRDV
jgi:phosphopantothenoylcysteine decarboxylase/phosphopantothenate--cysteine ligase